MVLWRNILLCYFPSPELDTLDELCSRLKFPPERRKMIQKLVNVKRKNLVNKWERVSWFRSSFQFFVPGSVSLEYSVLIGLFLSKGKTSLGFFSFFNFLFTRFSLGKSIEGCCYLRTENLIFFPWVSFGVCFRSCSLITEHFFATSQPC